MSPAEISVSYTALRTFLDCPQKYKFKYVDRLGSLYERQRYYFSFGNSMQKALTKFYSNPNQQEKTLENLQNALRECWISEGYDSQEQEASYQSQAMAALANFYHSKDFLGQPIYFEESFRIPMGGYSLIGVMDRIDRLPDGSLEVIDYKVAKAFPGQEQEDVTLQLSIYAFACWKKFGVIPSRLSLFFLTDNERVSFQRTERELRQLEEQIRSYVQQIQNEQKYLAKPGEVCKTCDFLTICPAMGLGIKPAKPETLQQDLISNIKYLESIRADLYALNQASQELSSALELPVLQKKVMEVFQRVGKVEQGALFLVNDQGNIECSSSCGVEAGTPDALICAEHQPILCDFFGKMEEPLLMEDLQPYLTLPFLKPLLQKLTEKSLIKSCIFIPLKFRETFLGFLFFAGKKTHDPFTNYDKVLFSNLASQTAISIQNAKLYELAITDGLTKLYIHRYFQTRLESELSRAKRYHSKLSLLLMDLDHFKKVNDTYGHQQGDQVLKSFAQIIRSRIRPSDVPARYGGEEFAILLPETSVEGAKQVGEKLRASWEEFAFQFPDGEKHFTASVGVSFWDGFSSREVFIQQADRALYKAKEMGRNRVCLYSDTTHY